MTPWCEKGERGQGDAIRCKGHVIGLFRPAWPGQRAGSRRVTGRGVTQATCLASCRSRSSTFPQSMPALCHGPRPVLQELVTATIVRTGQSYASHHWPPCHRWHAAWRASMTQLLMNQFNQTSGCRLHAACGACEIVSVLA